MEEEEDEEEKKEGKEGGEGEEATHCKNIDQDISRLGKSFCQNERI